MIIKKRVIADTEIKGTYRYKPTGKAVWVMREDEDFWRPWGCRDWTEEQLNKYKPEFKEKGWKDVILVENDGTDPNDVLIHDAYGQEILADKAWDAYESVKERLGAKKLLLSMEFAMGDAYEAVKELMGAQRLLLSFELAIGADELKEITEALNEEWNEDGLDLDELAAIADYDELLDDLAKYLSTDDLADYLTYIVNMNDIELPENFVKITDALWKRPDNNAGTAGRLANKAPIKYKNYLIMTREDGKFDVYTGDTFSVIGTMYKTVEEAKKNIDEGRQTEHIIEKPSDDDFDDDDEVVEVDEPTVQGSGEKTDDEPEAKRVNYAGFNFTKQADGTWTLKSGGQKARNFKTLLKGATFREAVNWLFKNLNVKEPTGDTRDERIIREYLH